MKKFLLVNVQFILHQFLDKLIVYGCQFTNICKSFRILNS